MRIRSISALLSLALSAWGCAGGAGPRAGATPARGGGLPEIPRVTGPIAIDVVYPGQGQQVPVEIDSTFIFGSLGTGEATLTINGAAVEVAPNGAFLAFLPVPANGIYAMAASAGGQAVRRDHVIVRPPPQELPPVSAADVVEYELLDQADSTLAPAMWYGVINTARADGTAIGTAIPGSGTPYHWFFPNGTRVLVSGEAGNGQLKIRLTDDQSVWVDSTDVDPLLPRSSQPAAERVLVERRSLTRGWVGNVIASPQSDYVDVRLSMNAPLPHRVDGSERGLTITVYGAETRTNNLLYGATDSLIHRMEWVQESDDLYRLNVELTQPLWGFQSFFDGNGTLVVRIRRPPSIDPSDPLRGLYIGVDAGHPPGGAIGPTRLTEAEATLGVSRRLAALLEARGARVLQTRPDTAAVGLGDRPLRATQEDVDLLVSVHFDAFGDGVNPFENHGTHVFYNQAQSLDLARAVQRELLAELGLRDLGVSRRDLALVRPTWMPSILSESAFMMIPRNEAALRDPRVLDRIAAAHLRGIEAFLRGRAAAR